MTPEEIVRSVVRVCKGPPLWDPITQSEFQELLARLNAQGADPKLMARARRKIQETLQTIEELYGKRIALNYPENESFSDVYANIVQLMRLHAADVGRPCGQDVNDLILEDGVFDGSDRTVICPRCGNTITYSLKIENA